MFKLLKSIFLNQGGTTLAITRKSSNTLITAAGFNTNYDEIEAVVNALTAANLAADSVTAAKLNADVVRADYGLKQHTDGTLFVDVSDTNPGLELSDGGLRALVYGILSRSSDGIIWGRTGDKVLTSAATTPDGFTDQSATYADKFIRISETPASAGGSDTHTHAAGTYAVSGTTGANTSSMSAQDGAYSVGAIDHDHTFSASVTGTSASGDNVPAYTTLRMLSKD